MSLIITIAALVGVLVTNAASEMYGEILWSPLTLLQCEQVHNYTAACRAGTFFAGAGLLSSQISVSLWRKINRRCRADWKYRKTRQKMASLKAWILLVWYRTISL